MALSSGASDPEPESEPKSEESKARIYDFRAANKFPKDQIRTLNIVFQTFAQLFSNQLTAMLRTSCESEVLSVEEISFNEFNNSLPSPVLLAIMELEPLHGSLIIQVSPEAAYMIINRVLGGAENNGDSSKPFTEIELALVERVLRSMMPVLEGAWDKVIQVNGRLERIETSPQFAQIVPLNEPVAIVSINVTIGESSGLISICMPHTAIEPVSKQLTSRTWFSSQEVRRGQEQIDSLNQKLHHTPVTMTAYFEETPATVSDIMNLQVGDVIRLNQQVKQPLMVKIQHIPKFYASIGTAGNRYAVKLTDLIKEDEENEPVSRGN